MYLPLLGTVVPESEPEWHAWASSHCMPGLAHTCTAPLAQVAQHLNNIFGCELHIFTTKNLRIARGYNAHANFNDKIALPHGAQQYIIRIASRSNYRLGLCMTYNISKGLQGIVGARCF